MSTTEYSQGQAPVPSGEQFVAIRDSPEFADLRHRLRRFVFPMTALFLAWPLTYCWARSPTTSWLQRSSGTSMSDC